ncbi:Uncharacterised protein [Mycobacteroides abscessus subsp. abscessus]|nr:Uncharacterised protein [Mycobacteroides abscessus subsp. abscessus]
MRRPRILTWKSLRPRYSSSRTARPSRGTSIQRTMSPVRYMRSPGAPQGLATKRAAVIANRLK